MRPMLLLVAVAIPFVDAALPPENDYLILRAPPLAIYYHAGSEVEAEEVRRVLTAALDKFAANLPPGDEPIHVVIAQSVAEFTRFAPAYAHLAVEGVAHSDTGVIVVKGRKLHRPDSSFPATLRHELVHVLLARNTAPGNLPRWLNEGIAMKLAGELHWAAPFRVARMYASNQIIPYSQVNFAFTSATDDAKFSDAYAQALSMTDYLHKTLGDAVFWELVHSLEYQSFGKAVQEYTGLTPLAFWTAWRQSLWKVAVAVSLVSGFTVFQVMAILTILAFLRRRKQARQKLALWSEEEHDDDLVSVWDLERQDETYPWEDDDEDN
jgi:hypothetical protein